MACDVNRVFVIGAGEVGSRLLSALDSAGIAARALTRATGLDPAAAVDDPALRIVAVREEQLAEVLGALASVPRERLVLVQNGFLEAVHGPLGPVTRGLIWFTSKGEFFEVLAPSSFHGPAAAVLAPALARGGIDARVIAEPAAFTGAMILKGLWNCVVGLPLAVHGLDLASYLAKESGEWHALLAEGADAASEAYHVKVEARAAIELVELTTATLGWVRGGAKALPWRNGALAWFGRRHGVKTPVNDALLQAVDYDPDRPPVTYFKM